jgi:hypothetical protein
MHPIEFSGAVRELLVAVGRPVRVTITDRRDVELTSLTGILADQSTAGRVEFAVEDLDGLATPLPLPLEEPRECALGDGQVKIATAGEVTVLFALDSGSPPRRRGNPRGGSA